MTSSIPKCLDSRNYLQKYFERYVILYGTCSFIVIIFVFEMSVVFAEMFEGLTYYLHLVFNVFLYFNMMGNFIVCSEVDTSIISIKELESKSPEKMDTLRFCEKCRVLTPPRSRHCDKCSTCILKKDHHCLFTGRCVGHNNFRYFMVTIVYVVITSAYTTCINSIYFWWIHPHIYCDIYRILCLVFPTFVFMQWTWDNDTGLSFDWHSLYILFFLLIVFAFLAAVIGFYTHFQNLLTGATSYDRKEIRGNRKYDLGSWRRNFEIVFGKNYYKVWLSPFFRSQLPHDGTHWSSALEEVSIKKL